MSDHEHSSGHIEDAGESDRMEQDNILAVLAALQTLARRTGHPVVRACLEQAHDDIVHLTSPGDEPPVEDGESVAA